MAHGEPGPAPAAWLLTLVVVSLGTLVLGIALGMVVAS